MKKGILITLLVFAVLVIVLFLKCENTASGKKTGPGTDNKNAEMSLKKGNVMPPGIVFEPEGMKNRYYIFLLSVSGNGEKRWIKKYTAVEPSWAEAVFVLSDGNIILLSREYDRQQGLSRPFVMLCDAGGKKLSETYLDNGNPPAEYKLAGGASLKIDPVREDDTDDTGYRYEVDEQDGNTYQRYSGMKYYEWGTMNFVDKKGSITELTNPEAPGSDYYDMNLIRKKEDGTKLWSSSFGGPGFERGYSFDNSSGGDIILAGVTDSYGTGDTDMFAVKVDAKGNSIWARNYGSGLDESAHAVSAGGKITAITGSSCGGKNGCDIILLLVDNDGNTRLMRTFDAGADESAYCISPFNDGYIIAGISGDF